MLKEFREGIVKYSLSEPKILSEPDLYKNAAATLTIASHTEENRLDNTTEVQRHSKHHQRLPTTPEPHHGTVVEVGACIVNEHNQIVGIGSRALGRRMDPGRTRDA